MFRHLKLIKFKKLSFKFNLNSLAALIGAFYLFFSTQPFFLWLIPGVSVFFLGLAFILLYLVYADKGLIINRKKLIILGTIFIFPVYMSLPIYGGTPLIGKMFLFSPLFLLFLLSTETLLNVFKIWKKILIFFVVYALIVYVLFALEVNMPYWKIENAEYIPITSRADNYYRVYGMVVSSTQTLWRIGGVLTMRLCGPFAEPGHFGIYLGFTMLIDRFLGNKTNYLYLIAGILTLSPAFIIILLIIESYRVIVEKRFNYKLYLAIFLVLFAITAYKGAEIKQRILYIAIERHSDLDDRAPVVVRKKYQAIAKSSKVIFGVGTENFKTFGGSLSDPRGMIAKFGLVGLFLSLSIIFLLLVGMKNKYAFFLLAAVFLVYAHRAWMFESPIIYIFMLVASAGVKIKERNQLLVLNQNALQ
jgi:hypothetical protein